MSKIVVVGKNGAGKGTLLDKFMAGKEGEVRIVAMSSLLSNVKETDPELWEKIDAIMKAGDLVPDEIIMGIIEKELEGETRNIIFDGFPRTKAQATAMINYGLVPDAIIEIDLPDELVVKRANERRVCSKCRKSYTVAGGYNPPKQDGICDDCSAPLTKRPDDEESVVRKRLAQYREQTYPVIEILAGAGAVCYTVDNSEDNDDAQISFNEIMNLFYKRREKQRTSAAFWHL